MEPELILAVVSTALGAATVTGSSELIRALMGLLQGKKSKGGPEKIEEFAAVAKKIESAKENIDDFLKGLADMTAYVERVREELVAVSSEVEKASSEKNSLEKRIGSLEELKKHDEDTIREVFGIPSKSQQKWTRWRGFFEGVAASLVASLIFAYGPSWSETIGDLVRSLGESVSVPTEN